MAARWGPAAAPVLTALLALALRGRQAGQLVLRLGEGALDGVVPVAAVAAAGLGGPDARLALLRRGRPRDRLAALPRGRGAVRQAAGEQERERAEPVDLHDRDRHERQQEQ